MLNIRSFFLLIGLCSLFHTNTFSSNVNTTKECLIRVKRYPYSLYEVVVIELKRREGFSSAPYKDGDGWTIGYGQHYKTKKDLPCSTMSEKQATALLQNTLKNEYAYIQTKLPKLKAHELWALVSLSYNIGLKRIRENETFWTSLLIQDNEKLRYAWLTDFSDSENKHRSRILEWSLFTNNIEKVKKLHKEAKEILSLRYAKKMDFSKKS